jgi:hypothetical protein
MLAKHLLCMSRHIAQLVRFGALLAALRSALFFRAGPEDRIALSRFDTEDGRTIFFQRSQSPAFRHAMECNGMERHASVARVPVSKAGVWPRIVVFAFYCSHF